MTKDQATQAMEIAQSNEENLCGNIDIFNGFGLSDFKPVYTTLRDVAGLIRWQCFQLDGNVNAEALNDLVTLGRKRFMIIG